MISLRDLAVSIGLEVDESAFAKVEAAIEHLKEGLFALGAVAAVGAAAIGLKSLATGVAEAGINAEHAAQRIGISTDALQELRFGAEMSGASAEELDNVLSRLAQTAGTAVLHPFDEASIMFQRFGIHIRNAAGQVLPANEILMQVAHRLEGMSEAARPAALRAMGLGREAGRLLPFLNRGAAGIAELSKKAHEFGVVLDQETIQKSKDWEEATVELHKRVEGFRNRIGVPILNALLKLHTVMGKLVTDFTNGKFHTALRAVAYLIGGVIVAALAANSAALISTIGWYAALSVASIRAAISSALAWGAAALPFIAIGVAVTALLALLDDFFNYDTPETSATLQALQDWKDEIQIVEKMVQLSWARIKAAFRVGLKEVQDLLNGNGSFLKAFYHVAAVATGNTGTFNKVFPGGAASPAAAAASAASAGVGSAVNVAAPQMSVQFHTVAAPGDDPHDVAAKNREMIEEWWNGKMREANDSLSPSYGVLQATE